MTKRNSKMATKKKPSKAKKKKSPNEKLDVTFNKSTDVFVMYKKIWVNTPRERIEGIAKLRVPASALRVWGSLPQFKSELKSGWIKNSSDLNYLDRKLRVSEAKVISITNKSGTKKFKEGYSGHDPDFKYRVGATVKPERKFTNRIVTCASGVHGFLCRKDAKRYCL